MKIVEPGYEIVQMPDGEEALRIIEYFGRIAYKSEDKIDSGECRSVDDGEKLTYEWIREPSSHKFVRMILQAERRAKMVLASKKIMAHHEVGWACSEDWPEAVVDDVATELVSNVIDYMRQNPAHESVIEHCSASVKFTSNRGFTHELVRHRLASFTQECVAGSTKVTRKYTIKELHDREETPQGKTHNKTIRLRSCREDGTIIRNKIVRVMSKGKQPTHKVTTKLGYVIEATGNHEFMLPDGSFRRLAEINVGESVMVNGRPSLLNICDEELKHYYLNLRQSPQEIADSFGAPYVSVLRRLKQLGIFVKHRNDKNPEKYNKNHTAGSYAAMRGTILKQYQEGREPWNKDVREGEHSSVDRQADSLRAHHHDNQLEEKNSNWQGGISSGYYQRLVPPGPCELCSAPNASEIHHINHNRRHNERDNLMRICINCHDKLHHGWHVGVVAHPDEIVSIEYAGEQEVYDIEMEAPYHNYVANGFVVHNSTRYCDYEKGKFGSEISVIERTFWGKRPEDRDPVQEENRLQMAKYIWADAMQDAERHYKSLRALGIPPEIARDVLNNALKADIGITANFREWIHVFDMRCAPAAHPDMRALMVPLRDEFRRRVPIIFDER